MCVDECCDVYFHLIFHVHVFEHELYISHINMYVFISVTYKQG